MTKYFIWGCLGILGIVMILGLIGSMVMNDTANNTESSKPVTENQSITVQPTKINEEPEIVETTEFIAEFDKNQLAAEEKFEGKLVQFDGYIKNISEDILSNPYLSIEPKQTDFYMGTHIQCFFNNKSDLTKLENGQKVVLAGKVDTQSLGIITIKDCQVIE